MCTPLATGKSIFLCEADGSIAWTKESSNVNECRDDSIRSQETMLDSFKTLYLKYERNV